MSAWLVEFSVRRSCPFWRDAGELEGRLAALQAALPGHDVPKLVRRYPSLLERCPGVLGHNLGVLEGLLPEGVDTRLVVSRQPSILAATEATLRSNMRSLERLLPSVPPEHIALFAPSLLQRDQEVLAANVKLLQELLPGHDSGRLVAHQPSLLQTSLATLRAKWRSLERRAALVPRWGDDLGEMSEATAATLLTYSLKRHDRLPYVAAFWGLLPEGRRDTASIQLVVRLSEKDFREKFLS